MIVCAVVALIHVTCIHAKAVILVGVLTLEGLVQVLVLALALAKGEVNTVPSSLADALIAGTGAEQ